MVLVADASSCFPPLFSLGEYYALATGLVRHGTTDGCSSQNVSALLPGCHSDLKQEGAEGKAGKCLQLGGSPCAPGHSSILSCQLEGHELSEAVPSQASVS